MRIINKPLLREFSQRTRCEFCGRPCESTDPAHIFSRGAGRVDVRCNLIALCRSFTKDGFISCHDDHHRGKIRTAELLEKVGKREGCSADDIEIIVAVLRRIPKAPRRDQVKTELRFLSQRQRLIMVRELKEAKVEWE